LVLVALSESSFPRLDDDFAFLFTSSVSLSLIGTTSSLLGSMYSAFTPIPNTIDLLLAFANSSNDTSRLSKLSNFACNLDASSLEDARYHGS